MGALFSYLAICAAPAAAFYAFDRALHWYTHKDSFAPVIRRRGALPRTGPSLQRLVEDLRRLEGEYRRIERSDLPAKAHRLRAVSLAYDDILCECCRALGLPPPERPVPARAPLSPWDRVQAELELARHGLTW